MATGSTKCFGAKSGNLAVAGLAGSKANTTKETVMPPKKTEKTPAPETLDTPEEQPSSGSTGDAPAEPEPKETQGSGTSAGSTPAETPAMKELREKVEAKAAAEPERPPHPYKWRLEAPGIVPFAFLDGEGKPSKEKIEAHIADCWRVGTPPSVAGVVVGIPRKSE